MPLRLALVVVFCAGVASTGCSPAPSCVEGMSVACACTDGRTGAQSCRAGRYTVCMCTGGTDAGPADAGTTEEDAAIATTDAGGTDAGVPPDPDAWTPGVDAGPPNPDLSSILVRNSPPDIMSWAETARITTLDLGTTGVFIDFTKRDGADSWPDVPFITPGEDLQYTLWIVIQVDGTWYTSGCIQYWRGLDRNGGPPDEYAMNWYYDAIRWGEMTGHQPAVGEWVGFFVAAGNHRNVTDHSTSIVLERSNIVWVPFPTRDGAVFTY